MNKKMKEIVEIFGKEPESLDELAHCVIAVIKSQKNSDWPTSRNGKYKIFKNHNVVGFCWDIIYDESVSNSHWCPVEGVMNWGRRDKSSPTEYPGWMGRVWIRFKEDPYSFNASDSFRKTLTHVGTGGGGVYNGIWTQLSIARYQMYGHTSPKDSYPPIHCFSWDYRFYQQDWPKLERSIQEERIISTLSGNFPKLRHNFEWEDHETKIKDAEFLTRYAIWNAKKAKVNG